MRKHTRVSRMSAFGQRFNSPIPQRAQQQPPGHQVFPSDPRLTPSYPWPRLRPGGVPEFRPPGQFPLTPGSPQSVLPHALPPPPPSPHGLFTGDPRSHFHLPGAIPFHQPLPHQLPPGIPFPLQPPNIRPFGGPYFQPPPHPTPQQPSLAPAPSLLGPGGLFGPRVPISPQPPPPPPDPTNVFIQEWLAGVTARHRESQATVQEDRPMKIPEVRGLLSHTLCLLSSLTQCHRELLEMRERGGERRLATMTQVTNWQRQLVEIRELVDRGDNVQRLGGKLAGTKRKRVRAKEGVKRRRREREEERKRSERTAELWLQNKRQEKLKEETERSVQSDASGVLGEVKRKQSDIQHYTKLLTSLKELRDLRREIHRKTGEPLVKEDEVFATECEDLTGILEERGRVYEEEEHALRVMIQEEVQERMLAGSTVVEAGATTEEGEGGEGGEGGETLSGTLHPHVDYYLQAERSVEALINIRKSWDMYLSVEGSPLPSHLPQPTATAPSPSSGPWNSYCIQSSASAHSHSTVS